MKRKQPITCTSCHQRFQTWPNWLAHRATIKPEEMGRYDNHTRRCLSLHDWAMMVLAEAMGAQEAVASSGQEDVQERESFHNVRGTGVQCRGSVSILAEGMRWRNHFVTHVAETSKV